MARKTNKQKFIEGCFDYIKNKPELQKAVIVIMKEKLDFLINDVPTLLYDKIYDTAAQVYDLKLKLNIPDDDTPKLYEEVIAVIQQLYYTSYVDITFDKLTL